MRYRLTLLPAIAFMLSAGQCAHDPVTPPADRFARIPLPAQPEGEAVCDGEPCLSEAQAADLMNALIDVACEANDKLAWLSDFYLRTQLPPSCGATN